MIFRLSGLTQYHNRLILLVSNITAAEKGDIWNVLTMVELLKDSLASPRMNGISLPLEKKNKKK